MKKVVLQKQKDKAEKTPVKPVTQKENGWIKFARFLVYVISIIGVIVGASLIKGSGLSAAYADGTYAALFDNGVIIFFVFLPILCGNIMWGILRWFLRGYREKWRPGRTIGKLIGGGIWRVLAIAPLVLLAFMVIAPWVSGVVSANVSEERNSQKGISLSEPLDHLEYISEHYEEYSLEELKGELVPYLFNNIDFDVDASSNVSVNRSSGFLTQNVSAYTPSVLVLNKAKISSAGHFIVFYTDIGDDGISDERAEDLAEMLEMIIDGYEDRLGFEYKYNKVENPGVINLIPSMTPDLTYDAKVMRMSQVLISSGIDAFALEYAMPVYVANPYKDGSSILASYAGTKFANILNDLLVKLGNMFGEETATLYNSTPSYPFINILPENINSESLAIVTAHELGHHYNAIYNSEHYLGRGSEDDFIDETAPNWMAINVLPNQPAINLINSWYYNDIYLHSTGITINHRMDGCDPDNKSCDGYPAVAFLENYYEIVPNAKTIIMDTVYYGDALNRLYEQAGAENFRKVMASLAEKNLTGDYDGKLMNYEETRRGKKYTLPKGEELQCADLCTKEYDINPAATEYLYFTVDEYRGSKLGFKSSDGVRVSVLGRNLNSEWTVLQSGLSGTEFEFTDDVAGKYNMVAFAVANPNINNSGEYEVGIAAAEFADVVDTTGGFDFGELFEDLGQGCFELNLDSLFDLYGEFMNYGGEVLGAIAAMDDTTDYSEMQDEWAKETEKAKEDIEKAKQEAAKYRISVCANYIVKGRKFEEVKETLQKAMGWNMIIYDERSGSNRVSVFFGFDLLTRQGKIYVLAEESGEMGLITINVSEK